MLTGGRVHYGCDRLWHSGGLCTHASFSRFRLTPRNRRLVSSRPESLWLWHLLSLHANRSHVFLSTCIGQSKHWIGNALHGCDHLFMAHLCSPSSNAQRSIQRIGSRESHT